MRWLKGCLIFFWVIRNPPERKRKTIRKRQKTVVMHRSAAFWNASCLKQDVGAAFNTWAVKFSHPVGRPIANLGLNPLIFEGSRPLLGHR
jgi:hypothetical protein